jgi:metal-responsive CopG/Arc/MetJ family transcriptional regulator
MTSNNEYVTVKIPAELAKEIDQLIGKHGFTSRGEVAKEAIRKLLQTYNQKKET